MRKQCPWKWSFLAFAYQGYVHSILKLYLKKDDATGIVNQVQQATPSDKSTEQNPAITPATSQGFATLPGACQNPLVSTGLISPDLAEILRPVNHDEKIKPPRVIIEERVLTEDDSREKIAEKKTERIVPKTFSWKKRNQKNHKKGKETSTITLPVEPTKSAEETIHQPTNTVPLIASLKTKMEEPASTFSALTNITISIPE